jgi:hypothetical protein
LGILGSAADLAAIAAFFIFVLLIGIHAPDAHAMPRTQNSGQARRPRRAAAKKPKTYNRMLKKIKQLGAFRHLLPLAEPP